MTKAQNLLLDFTNSELALRFDRISDDLVVLLKKSCQEVIEAEALEQQASSIAQVVVITSGSLGMSIAIALIPHPLLPKEKGSRSGSPSPGGRGI